MPSAPPRALRLDGTALLRLIRLRVVPSHAAQAWGPGSVGCAVRPRCVSAPWRNPLRTQVLTAWFSKHIPVIQRSVTVLLRELWPQGREGSDVGSGMKLCVS